MYFEVHNAERYFAFFGAVWKCQDISLVPQSATSSTFIFKVMTMCPVFLDHQKCYSKEACQIKQLFRRLVSPDCVKTH